MWLTSPRALHAAHVSVLTTSAAKAPAPGAGARHQGQSGVSSMPCCLSVNTAQTAYIERCKQTS